MAVRFSRFDRWGKLIGTLDGVYRAEHTDELNGEDIVELSLTGEIRKGDRIVWADSLGTWHEHIVREVSEISDGDGRRREAVCENSVAELYGDFVEDIRPTNKTCASALSQVLSGGGTRWSVGTVTVEGLASCTMYRESAREALSDILKTWGGELSTTIEVSGCEVTARKVNITRRGSDRGRRFEYGKGMSEIARVYSADDVYTAMYGFGKGEETGGGYGRRIDFSSQGAYGPTDGGTVHVSGKMYVENPEALEEWGRPGGSGKAHVFGSVSFTDCEDPAELMRLTAMQLDSLCQPKVSYEASVAEFAKWGYDFSDSFTGDTVAVIDSAEGFDIRVRARVTKTVRDLLDECALTQLTVGNIVSDVSGMIADQYAEVKDVTRRSSAWDVAAFTTNSYMEQLVGRFNTRFEEGGVYKYESFEQGTVYSSVPLDDEMRPVSTPAMAFQLKGGGFRISDTVGPDGNFVWSTMADGSGIVAESIVTGTLSDAEGKNFWNLDTGEFSLQSYAQKESTIQSVDVEYALGDSPDSAPSTGWSTDTPQWTAGKYIWQRTVTTMADGSVGYSDPACIQGAKGQDGKDGTSVTILGSYDSEDDLKAAHPSGITGDAYIVAGDLYVWTGSQWKNVGAIQGPSGESAYVHFAYANSADGSQGFSTSPFEGAVYMGVMAGYSSEPSASPSDYTWSRVLGYTGPAGKDGADGIDGKDGRDGTDGTSSYVHIKYSSYSSPTDAQITDEPSEYIGICTDSNPNDPTTASSYAWSKWEGRDGSDGIPGAPGSDGVSTYVHFAYATSADGSQGFSTSVFDGAVYVGVRTDFQIADSSDYRDYAWSRMLGDDGRDGTGVASLEEQYYLSSSSTSQTGGSWGTAQPAWASGKYIWTRTKVTWTDGSTTYTSPVLANAINGANQSANDANQAVSDLDASLTQQEVFNRLTGGGGSQGIYLSGGKVYINADYIKAGTLIAKRIADESDNSRYAVIGTDGEYYGIMYYAGGKLAFNLTGYMYNSGLPAMFANRVPYKNDKGVITSQFIESINDSSINFSNMPFAKNSKGGTYVSLQVTPNGVSYYNDKAGKSYKVFAMPGQADVVTMAYGFKLFRNGSTASLVNDKNQTMTIQGNWAKISLGTVPEGYRPGGWMTFQPVVMSGHNIYLQIEADGNATIVNADSTAYTGIVPVSGTWAICN